MKKIAILGCGGVGGYYGGKLADFYSRNNTAEIIFIARGKHLDAIRAHGLKIVSPSKEFTVHPKIATDSTAELGSFDLMMVCVKTYDISAALASVRSNVGAGTVIIPLVNGIEGYELIKAEFPSAKVFQGCCYLNSFVEAPGVIKFRGGFEQVQIGFHNEALLKQTAAVLSSAGIDIFSAPDVSAKVWEKFIFGSVLSGIGSLENESFGEIAANPARIQLARSLMNELFRVAQAKKIPLADTLVDELLAKISTFPAEARTSMQLDFTNGKRTELETFVGYVIRAANEVKVEVPEYRKLYEVLKRK
jgi:2-dehydropantoate 2-reductase